MAAADCELCAVLGHRSCDVCGAPIWEVDESNPATLVRDAFGRELCELCAGL